MIGPPRKGGHRVARARRGVKRPTRRGEEQAQPSAERGDNDQLTACHGGWEASRRVGEALLESRVIEIAGLSDEQLESAWREFVRSAGRKLSLCDAASFILMRERGVARAFTFDRHFAEAGFELSPG